MALSIIIFCFW